MTNRDKLAKRDPRGWLAAGSLLFSLPAFAALEAYPYVSTTVEHDDNVYRYRDGAEALADNGTSRRADTLQRYAAGLVADYTTGRQRLFIDGEARSVRYDRFDTLDHDGHDVSGGLDWALGSAVNGQLKLRDERGLQSFATRSSGNQPGLQDNTTGSLSANLRVLADYELRSRVQGERLRHTRAASRGEDRDESAVALGAAYLGRDQGSVGFEVALASGEYIERSPAEGVTEDFDQVTYELVATWMPSPISTFKIEGGVTDRDNHGINVRDYSGGTGAFSYVRNISPKTSLRFEARRRAQSVEQQDANFVVLTGGELGADWNATPKILVGGSYFYQDDKYQGSPAFEAQGDRKDQSQGLRLRLRYIPLDWLVLTPEVAWEDRSSSIDTEEYDDLRVSLELRLRYPIR